MQKLYYPDHHVPLKSNAFNLALECYKNLSLMSYLRFALTSHVRDHLINVQLIELEPLSVAQKCDKPI